MCLNLKFIFRAALLTSLLNPAYCTAQNTELTDHADVSSEGGRSEDWLFDLSIDSDNNNGTELPDRSDWEEQIEAHDFSIGKLIEVGAYNFTPLVIRLNNESLTTKISKTQSIEGLQVILELESSVGEIRFWKQPIALLSPKSFQPGKKYHLRELNYDPQTFSATIWIEAVSAAPGIRTKEEIDRNGRPDLYVHAKLLGIEATNVISDKVKYLPVESDSFFETYVLPKNRRVRDAIAAILANGTAGIAGTDVALPPIESEAYAQRLVTEDELKAILSSSGASSLRTKQILDMVYYHVQNDFTALDDFGYANLRVALFRDWNSGDYTLAFQRGLKNGVRAFALDSYLRVKTVGLCALIEMEIQSKRSKMPGLWLTGVGLGGELAVFGSLGSGINASTYNTETFSRKHIQRAITTYDPKQKKVVEHPSVGALARIEVARILIRSYRLEETPFQVSPGEFPIESSH